MIRLTQEHNAPAVGGLQPVQQGASWRRDGQLEASSRGKPPRHPANRQRLGDTADGHRLRTEETYSWSGASTWWTPLAETAGATSFV